MLDPNTNSGSIQHDGTPIEFGGNTPSGGKFAEPWDMHGWTADPEHKKPSGLKTKTRSVYGEDDDRQARVRKEVAKCTPPDDD